MCTNFLLANESIFGELGRTQDEKPSMFSAEVGLWNITWIQTSTSADFLNNPADAINTTYTIDDSLAVTLKLNFNYEFISANMEYFNSKGATGLGFDVALLELIPYANVELRYVNSNFKGSLYAKRESDGVVFDQAFESPLNIVDIIVYPFNKYIGIGYRYYKYELIEDAYMINNSTGNLIDSGFMYVNHEGTFYTLSLDNKKEVSSRKNYEGMVFSVLLGYGELESITNLFPAEATAPSDALFYDLILGYSYNVQDDNGYGYGLGVGYRYNKIYTTANKSTNQYDISVMTEFLTDFHGPYVDVSVSF